MADGEGVDLDPEETREWLEALDAVLAADGPVRAHYLLQRLVDQARRAGADLPYSANTAYLNTIPRDQEAYTPGNPELEWRIRSLVRWNAMAMVVRANRKSPGIGGHIASFASAATLYDVGFNHFFRATAAPSGGPVSGPGEAPGGGPGEAPGGGPGDLLFYQGHSAPGIYARAFLEGALTETQLENFRHETEGQGLSSYPHPHLMPGFWRFPTVSMGLGPLMAIYQARFLRYLHHRGLADTSGRRVWAFMGDGEMDEPESLGAIGLAARERLDNLLFVVNCNLQRLDGPVRGNGKIIQELEADFRGAGWRVIKVIWGSHWDPLLAQDHDGLLLRRMEEAVDGEYQAYKAFGGDYVRRHFFGKYPELAARVARMSDDDIWRLNRGGHDPHKVYAAFAAAMEHTGQPTVILAKTVKGYGMGEAGEGMNYTHQQKKMGEDAIRKFRDRFHIQIPDDQVADPPFLRPAEDSPEARYLRERRAALGGSLFAAPAPVPPLPIPGLALFAPVLAGGGERETSTTMAFVRLLTALIRDPDIGPRVVPIVPDEARTFGMEGLFRQIGIYSSAGQLYEPVDSHEVMPYREDLHGQILEEGICEAGGLASWIAAGSAARNHGLHMVPFFIFYSMFGFQRVGDLVWAGADMGTRGFLLGGTAGRTTLAGEGLQHQDGHSHLLAATVPTCRAYDPAYGYELAVVLHDGLQRMYGAGEECFYYITVLNENYRQPALPPGAEEGIRRGMYLLRPAAEAGGIEAAAAAAAPAAAPAAAAKAGTKTKAAKAASGGPAGTPMQPPRVQLLGSGAILREVLAAAEMLAADWGVAADVYSVTSFTELRREGLACARWNLLHPEAPPRVSYVESVLDARPGPVVAATDYMKAYADQIREFVPRRYRVLGTDGFGRSDSREALRAFFEVDRRYVAVAALQALAEEGACPAARVAEALRRYGIPTECPDPASL
jgi:pyruvate dehydrogenase E1 component